MRGRKQTDVERLAFKEIDPGVCVTAIAATNKQNSWFTGKLVGFKLRIHQ